MAITVDEIMNRELFHLRASDDARRAATDLQQLGIGSAPVLDGARRPLGVASLRDLAGAPPGATVGVRMSQPVIALRSSASIESAARLLGEAGIHHAPVVDDEGAVVGFVSSLDLLRALVGLPARHPAEFAHADAELGVTWSEDAPLDMNHVDGAPATGGVLAIVHGGVDLPETTVWAEPCANLRARLIEILSPGRKAKAQLAHWMDRGKLRFRWAAVDDELERRAVAAAASARNGGAHDGIFPYHE